MSRMNRVQANEIRQSLDKLIQQDIQTKEVLTGARESLKNWQTHELALSNSNDKIRMELKNLQTENANLTQQTTKKTVSHLKLDEEFRRYVDNHDEEDQKFWNFFVVETDKYRNLFTNAEAEYDTISLQKNIEHYRKMSSNVIEKSVKADEEMVGLTDTYGLIELNTNEKANCLNDLQKFQRMLMGYDKSMSLSIRSAENRIQILNSKLRQKRREMENISKKIKQ